MRRRTIRNGAMQRQQVFYQGVGHHDMDTDDKVEIPDAEFGYFDRADVIRNPEWAARRTLNDAFVQPTGYTHSSRFRRYASGYIYQNSGGIRYVGTGVIEGSISHGFGDLTFLDPTKVVDQAITRALSNLKGQDINLSQAFAEREQVSKMFLDTAKKLAKSINNVKKGKILQAARDLLTKPKSWMKNIPPPKSGEVPGHWLALKYGWEPLLGDIHGACKALAEKDLKTERYRITVRGRSEDSDFVREDFSSVANVKLINHISKSVRGVAIFHYTLPDSAALSQASSLGLINPFSVAWELVPFSFVIDWALPIGDFLNVLDAASPFQWLGGCTVAVQEIHATGAIMTKGGTGLTARGYRNYHAHEYYRGIYSSSPRPSLPHLNTNKSAPHVANGLALIGAAFASAAK